METNCPKNKKPECPYTVGQEAVFWYESEPHYIFKGIITGIRSWHVVAWQCTSTNAPEPLGAVGRYYSADVEGEVVDCSIDCEECQLRYLCYTI